MRYCIAIGQSDVAAAVTSERGLIAKGTDKV